MGSLRFEVTDPQRIDPRVWQTAYITGMEGVPWQCQHRIQGNQFIISRELDESGKANIVWPCGAFGNLCLSTTSLRSGDTNYWLLLELARGTLSRLKGQVSEWQRMGLRLPDNYFPAAEQAQQLFLKAATHRGDSAQMQQLAQQSIEASIQASAHLCEAFANQALDSRRQNEGRLTTLLGVRLPTEVSLTGIGEGVQKAFNLVNISAHMGQVEKASGRVDFSAFDTQLDWAVQSQMRVCMGPLVDFRPHGLPQWMILLGQDPRSILNAACAHAEATVQRYRGKVQLWNCAAGLNSPNKLRWSDEEILRMAVGVIETVRRADNRTPVLLSIDQPWSEYLRDDGQGISPLHFADALIRADLGLSGLSLELSLDRWPGGSLPRDLIEINRLIDRWSMLGLPLLVQLTSPTSGAGRSNADSNSNSPRVNDWHFDLASLQMPTARSNPNQESGFIAPQSILHLLASKPSVHAIIWDQLTDQIPVASSTSGLWDASGKPKPLLSQILNLRRNFLN